MSKDVRDAVRILRDALSGIVIPRNKPVLPLILARATLLNAITHISQGERKVYPKVGEYLYPSELSTRRTS